MCPNVAIWILCECKEIVKLEKVHLFSHQIIKFLGDRLTSFVISPFSIFARMFFMVCSKIRNVVFLGIVVLSASTNYLDALLYVLDAIVTSYPVFLNDQGFMQDFSLGQLMLCFVQCCFVVIIFLSGLQFGFLHSQGLFCRPYCIHVLNSMCATRATKP